VGGESQLIFLGEFGHLGEKSHSSSPAPCGSIYLGRKEDSAAISIVRMEGSGGECTEREEFNCRGALRCLEMNASKGAKRGT